MPRPRIPRRLRFNPEVYYFKPRGVRLQGLEEVVLASDEMEALKLVDSDGLKQEEAAKKMEVSQPTLARILASGRKKLTGAVVGGQAIRIEGV